MNILRKTLAIVLMCSIIISLAACAGTASTTTTAASTTKSANVTTTAATGTTKAPASTEVINIGLDISLTGNNAVTCERFLHAAKLAVSEINAGGGILGRKVELVSADAQSTNAGSISAYELLASKNVVGIIGPENTSMAVAAADIVKKYGIPSFVPATGVYLMDDKYPDNWFRMLTADNVVTEKLAAYMVNEKKYKNIAVIYDSGTYGVGCLQYFTEALAKYNIKPSASFAYNQGDTDFTAQFLAAEKAGAEVVMVFTPLSSDAAVIVRQYAELGKKYQFFGSLQYSTSAVYGLAKNATDGIYCSQQFNPDATKEAKAFFDKYSKEYKYPADQFSAIGYDACYLLKKAVEAAGSTDKEAIKKEIYKIKGYQGVLAMYNCNDRGDLFDSINIVHVDKGVYTKVG